MKMMEGVREDARIRCLLTASFAQTTSRDTCKLQTKKTNKNASDEWFDMMCVLLTPILSFKNYAFICGVFCYGICLVITL